MTRARYTQVSPLLSLHLPLCAAGVSVLQRRLLHLFLPANCELDQGISSDLLQRLRIVNIF